MGNNTNKQSVQFSATIQALKNKAHHTPQKVAFRMLDASFKAQNITFSELYNKVQNSAGKLRTSMIKEGDVCLLIFPQGLEFIVGFLACNWVGAIPVPLNMPSRNKPLEKWEKIAMDCHARFILTDPSSSKYLTTTFSKSKTLNTINLVEIKLREEQYNTVYTDYHELAFLQYTSGSTGNPKGVMVTQQSLQSNSNEIRRRLSFTPDSVMVSWLPFYHDMGLIIAILQGIFTGHTIVLMSPLDFMSQPLLWIKAISFYKATHTGAPNFAFELVAEKLEKLEKLENISLETLKIAVCGAEPLHIGTIQRFNKIALKFGMKKGVICPSYGLAEATLLLSANNTGDFIKWLSLDKESLQNNTVSIIESGKLNALSGTTINQNKQGSYLISNGKVIDNHSFSIRDPQTEKPLKAFQIGELWFSGSSVTKGYYSNTEATLENYVKPTNSSKAFLRTGDLGFLDENDEFFITGRIKDVIIIRGLNHYPQDIERTSFSSSEFLRTDGAAAFSITQNNQEKLILVQEVTRAALRNPQYEQWVELIIEEIIKNHEIIVESILFVPPMHVPRTTSGKIQHSKAKHMYKNNEWSKLLHHYTREKSRFEILDLKIERKDALKEFLVSLISQQLGISKENINENSSFMEIGINSMLSLYIRDEVEKILDIPIRATDLFNYNTINTLSAFLWKRKTDKNIDANSISTITPNKSAVKEKDYNDCSEEDLLILLSNELKEQK